jgi:hypothetical protein
VGGREGVTRLWHHDVMMTSSLIAACRWAAGTVFLADHTVVHAGPAQPRALIPLGSLPRMVLFATGAEEGFGTQYNVRNARAHRASPCAVAACTAASCRITLRRGVLS